MGINAESHNPASMRPREALPPDHCRPPPRQTPTKPPPTSLNTPEVDQARLGRPGRPGRTEPLGKEETKKTAEPSMPSRPAAALQRNDLDDGTGDELVRWVWCQPNRTPMKPPRFR